MDKHRASPALNSESPVLYKMPHYLTRSYHHSNQTMLDNEGVLNEKATLIIKKYIHFYHAHRFSLARLLSYQWCHNFWCSAGSWLVRITSLPEPIDAQKKGVGPEESCPWERVTAVSNAGLSFDLSRGLDFLAWSLHKTSVLLGIRLSARWIDTWW